MKYFKENKDAWEEAFEKHQHGYEKNPVINELKSDFAYINSDLLKELKLIGLKDKAVAQFCCNNGRELLSVVQTEAKSGTGFDFAENFIIKARDIAQNKNINCNFICTNILDITDDFKEKYDIVFCTIGSICWFKDLSAFFDKVNLVLKPSGYFMLSDNHPVSNIFAMENEDVFKRNQPDKIIYSYFKKEPWIETNGMDYIGNSQYKSKKFTSFSHTVSDIINAMVNNNLVIMKLNEYNYSLYEFDSLNNRGIPLSLLIVGKKT